MMLRCHLRELRGDRSLASLAEVANVNKGTLSRIERGRELPKERDVAALERAYKAPAHTWFPDYVLTAIMREDGP
jgi:transcriptional regulator with XRE-family HTH domain